MAKFASTCKLCGAKGTAGEIAIHVVDFHPDTDAAKAASVRAEKAHEAEAEAAEEPTPEAPGG